MSALIVFTIRTDISFFLSGRTDLNRRPLQPHCSALAKLGYAPRAIQIIPHSTILTSRSHFEIKVLLMPDSVQRLLRRKRDVARTVIQVAEQIPQRRGRHRRQEQARQSA